MSQEREVEYQELKRELDRRSKMNFIGWISFATTGLLTIGVFAKEFVDRTADDYRLEYAVMTVTSFLAYGVFGTINKRRSDFINRQLKEFENQSSDNNEI